MLRAKVIKGCGQKKFLHLLRCLLSGRGRKDKLLNQLLVMCRKILGTLEHGICRVQRAAYCDTGSAAGTLTGHWLSREANRPVRLCSLWYVNCLIQSKGRNLNFSVSRSSTLRDEAGELMLLALMFSQFLKLSGSLCTQAISHAAQENSAQVYNHQV